MRDIGIRIQRYKLSRYRPPDSLSDRARMGLTLGLAAWAIWALFLSDHSAMRLLGLGQKKLTLEQQLAATSKDVDRRTILQIAAEPDPLWDAEPLLRLLKRRLRKELGRQPAEDNLLNAPAQLVPRRNARHELHERVVEERRPRLEGVGHARTVHLGEDVVDQVALDVDVLDARERIPAAAPLEVRGERVEGIMPVQIPPERFPVEIALHAGREPGHRVGVRALGRER